MSSPPHTHTHTSIKEYELWYSLNKQTITTTKKNTSNPLNYFNTKKWTGKS